MGENLDVLSELRVHGEVTMTLRTRTPVCGARTTVINRLGRLRAAGVIEEFEVQTWPDEVVLSDGATTDDAVQTFERFERWADERGVSVRPAFDVRTLSSLVGRSREVLTLPMMSLAVSADGSTFFDGLSVDNATGIVDQPRLPRIKEYTNYDNYVGVGAWTKIGLNNTDATIEVDSGVGSGVEAEVAHAHNADPVPGLAGSCQERPEQRPPFSQLVDHSSAEATPGKEVLQGGQCGQNRVVQLGRFHLLDSPAQCFNAGTTRLTRGSQGEGRHRAMFEHLFDSVNVH